MKFFITIIVTALLSLAACLYLPWYAIAPAAAIVALVIPQKPWHAFGAGFIALFIAWAGLAAYISFKNEQVLAHKISLLILQVDSPFLLIFATGLIGGLVAGFAAIAASYIRYRPIIT